MVILVWRNKGFQNLLAGMVFSFFINQFALLKMKDKGLNYPKVMVGVLLAIVATGGYAYYRFFKTGRLFPTKKDWPLSSGGAASDK